MNHLDDTAPDGLPSAFTPTRTLLASLMAHKAHINQASTAHKNRALAEMADALLDQADAILRANAKDVAAALASDGPLIDRLALNEERLQEMAQGIRALIDLPDPVGRLLECKTHANGMRIDKVTVPFGLLGMIYESRPNVTSDAAGLAVKSGNALILRSGKEAAHSARAIMHALKAGLRAADMPAGIIELVEDLSRTSAYELMTAKGVIDLLIPRGGATLIASVVERACVPVIETGTGICHIYVDAAANVDMALSILINAKTQRPSVCNAAEVLLVHADIARVFLERVNEALGAVELRACNRAMHYLPQAVPATDTDFDTEFLASILAVKVVDDLTDAIAHINAHSTGHSEAIVTQDPDAACAFTQAVDAAAVYVNASTRFTDGGQFGLGCELGISTQKMHARGPMGLGEMVTYKYIIQGKGQIR